METVAVLVMGTALGSVLGYWSVLLRVWRLEKELAQAVGRASVVELVLEEGGTNLRKPGAAGGIPVAAPPPPPPPPTPKCAEAEAGLENRSSADELLPVRLLVADNAGPEILGL